MKPILCRPGGKKLLVKRLLKEAPPHKTYVEPLVGSGGLFFTKEPAKKNVLADNDKDLMNFYKEIKSKGKLNCDLSRNKSKFERLKNKKAKTACDYLYVTRQSYGCKRQTFQPYSKVRKINPHPKYEKQLEKLQHAKLHTSDFKKVIKKYDSKDTFFYIDPPYHDTKCYYPKGSCAVTPQDVAESVKGLKGKFLLSYNDNPEVRKMFCKKYKCKRVQTKYSLDNHTKKKQKARKELLIKNY